MTNRRSFSLGLLAAPGTLAACATNQPPEPSKSSPLVAAEEPELNVDESERVLKPAQCLVGLPEAEKTVIFGFSLHCGATRDYIRSSRDQMRVDLLNGKRRYLLTHLARTANEVPVAVELLKVASERYPDAVLSALSLAAKLDAPLTLAHVRILIEEHRFPLDREQDDEELAVAVFATHRAFREHSGVSATPYIKEIS